MDTYTIPENTHRQLEAMVDRIEARPGRQLQPSDFEPEISAGKVLSTLPRGMSEEDFVGILKLAMLTECATDTYATEITTRARIYGAPWLERFNERVWKPDEYMHAEPFKKVLMCVGFSEEELEREMVEAQEREFEHQGGDTPVHVTTFGMIQEYMTDHYHGLISTLLKPAMPEASIMTARIKQRETLHTVWYRDMTAAQIEANPDFIPDVAFEIAKFRLPGNSVAPDYQKHAVRWLPMMGADFTRITRELVRLVHSTVGSPERLGRFAFELATVRDQKFGALKPQNIEWAMNRMGGWGYGLVGEAILEKAGCGYLYKTDEDRKGGIANRTRALLRTWLARQIPVAVA